MSKKALITRRSTDKMDRIYLNFSLKRDMKFWAW